MHICFVEMKGCNVFSKKCVVSLLLSISICMMSSRIAFSASATISAENVIALKIENYSEPEDSSLAYIPIDSTGDNCSDENLISRNAFELPFRFTSFNQFQISCDSMTLNKIGSVNICPDFKNDSSYEESSSKRTNLTKNKTFLNSNAILAHNDSVIISIDTNCKTLLKIRWFQNWSLLKSTGDTAFIYKPKNDFHTTDTVTAVICDVKSDSMLIQSWFITKPIVFDSAGVYVYRLSGDSSAFKVDTLQYNGYLSMYADSSFVEYMNNDDSLYSYLKSIHIDSNATDSMLIHSVFKNYSDIFIQDSSLQTYLSDRSLDKTDSLNDADADSLELSYQLSDTSIRSNYDSLFLDIAPDSGEIIDSLAISYADSLIDSSMQIDAQYQPDGEDSVLVIQSYTPGTDTACSYNDTLRFSVYTAGEISQQIIFQWFMNDSLIAGEDDSIFNFIPIQNKNGIDTIFTVISDTSKHYNKKIIWYVEKYEPENNMPEIISYLPRDTILSFLGDTLVFSVVVQDQEQDSLIFRWFKNDSLLENNQDSSYSFFKNDSSGTADTVHVRIQDVKHDSMIEFAWYVLPPTPEERLPEFKIYPKSDTLLAIQDSLLFKSIISNVDIDTLYFKWFLNEQLIENDDDSTYLYFCKHKYQEKDTLAVTIHGADQDTIATNRWIISKYSSSKIIDELLFLPEADTFVTKGDSLRLSVTSGRYNDSLKYVWFFNSKLIFDHSDSVYTYKPDSVGLKIDTIQIFVIDMINDTSRSYNWRLWNDRPRIPIKLISCFPANDTTIFRGDSLQFGAKIDNPLADSLSFRWFMNAKELVTENDSTFFYVARDSIFSADSIQVYISDRDTVITVKWCVHLQNKPARAVLPSPELIFPINQEEMCEEDKFIWSIDSLNPDDSDAYRYVVQISTDTLFSNVIVSDTVDVDTSIRCDQLKNYNKLEKQQSYFWRMKAIGQNEEASEYIKSKNDFRYLPLFVELTNFYAERNTKGYLVLYWETGYEMQNFGFNIYRSRQAMDNFIKINDDVIVGEGSYSYIDETVTAGETFYYKIEEICKNGKKKTHHPITVETPMPENFNLFPNYPNPFNTITLLRYQLPVQSHVNIDIYNVLGRRIRTIIDEIKEAGFYTVTWDGLDNDGVPVVSGLYFYQMRAGSFKTTRKMTVVR